MKKSYAILCCLTACLNTEHGQPETLPFEVQPGTYLVDVYIESDTCFGEEGKVLYDQEWRLSIDRNDDYLLERILKEDSGIFYRGHRVEPNLVVLQSQTEGLDGWGCWYYVDQYIELSHGYHLLEGTITITYDDCSRPESCTMELGIVGDYPPVEFEPENPTPEF
jgi:hypothetical protein